MGSNTTPDASPHRFEWRMGTLHARGVSPW
jgi:hypothetical protein